MDNPKKQIVERVQQAANILVTVSTNPSVDQLSAAIGLTLMLNRLDKHGTAVFSGDIPNTIEFLQPEKTLEKTTDSLRDFIIALDKAKADKLRYKVEDQMVKIFITPYRTSITDKDLEFSQGDFNVDVVIALGVHDQADLDQAITAHGRILHDATVIGLSNQTPSSLGSINWNDTATSSLCEMVLGLGLDLKQDILDGQTATALLTGIVAETERFSNEKTSSETMQMSAKLMAAGANQQLVASQLEAPPEPEPEPEPPVEADSPVAELSELPLSPTTDSVTDEEPAELPEPVSEEPPAPETVAPPPPADGSLIIDHGKPDTTSPEEAALEAPEEVVLEEIQIDENGMLKTAEEAVQEQAPESVTPVLDTPETPSPARLIVGEPALPGSLLTALGQTEQQEPLPDPLAEDVPHLPLLSHGQSAGTLTQTPASADNLVAPPSISDSLADLEKSIQSPHVEDVLAPAPTQDMPPPDISSARDAVLQTLDATDAPPLTPVIALNAQPMDLDLDHAAPYIDQPQNLVPPDAGLPADNSASPVTDPTAPPTVPPPLIPFMPPPTGNPNNSAL